jgi:SAM-dependent methyltransferase
MKHLTLSRVRNKIRAESLAVHDRMRDLSLGIWTRDDRREFLRPALSRARPNTGTNYKALDIVAGKLSLTSEDVLYDLGCGFGRALCYFARQDIARCVGIELRPDVAAVAQANADRLRQRRCPIEIRVGDAAEQDYATATILFLYNPFDGETLRRVLKGVRSDRSGRPFRLAYLNPLEEQVLAETPWLDRESAFDVPYRGASMRVSLWRTTGR